jgi:hypothetical protein
MDAFPGLGRETSTNPISRNGFNRVESVDHLLGGQIERRVMHPIAGQRKSDVDRIVVHAPNKRRDDKKIVIPPVCHWPDPMVKSRSRNDFRTGGDTPQPSQNVTWSNTTPFLARTTV